MDLLQRLGGRKFLMAMIAMGIGTYLELTGHPISSQMAGLLVALVGSFHVANHMTTTTYLKSRQSGAGLDTKIDQVMTKVDRVHEIATTAQDGEAAKQVGNILKGIQDSLGQVQSTTLQAGQLMVNVAKDVQAVKKATTQPLNF